MLHCLAQKQQLLLLIPHVLFWESSRHGMQSSYGEEATSAVALVALLRQKPKE